MLGNSARIAVPEPRKVGAATWSSCLPLGKGKTSTQPQFHQVFGGSKCEFVPRFYLRSVTLTGYHLQVCFMEKKNLLIAPCWFLETAPLSWGRLKTQLTNWCFKSPCKLQTSANTSTKLYIHTLNLFPSLSLGRHQILSHILGRVGLPQVKHILNLFTSLYFSEDSS